MSRSARLALAFGTMAAALAVAIGCEAIKENVPYARQASEALGLLSKTSLTPEDEREIGRGVSANLLSQYPLYDDAGMTRYVTLVGAVVASQSDQPDWNYRFGIIDTPEVNAFSTPGGFIYITKGTLAQCKSEAELAGVLGHEIAHVALRHGAKAVEGENLKKFGILVGSTAAEAASGYKMTDTAFTGIVDELTDGMLLRPRDRDQEIEADRIGERYAAAAGYYPFGLRDFLVRLRDRARPDDSAFKTFLATHPQPADRVTQIEGAIRSDGLRDGGEPRLPDRFRKYVRL
jgi:predicted Zn-dependent protease